MGKQIAWAKKVDSARDAQNNTVWGIRPYILRILRWEYCMQDSLLRDRFPYDRCKK